MNNNNNNKLPLILMYITNIPEVAKIAQEVGVDRIWIDMEYIGKDKRQAGMNTVQSHHTIEDIKIIKNILTTSKLQVRINPINPGTKEEIDNTIISGADYIMLPYFKKVSEVKQFINFVNRRANTILLLETKEAVNCLDEILEIEGIDEIHIGLNDLHLSYKKTFMFELLIDGTVDNICDKIEKKGIRFGFGGIARIGSGILPAEVIIGEHYRLGSSMAILARAFCNTTSSTLDLNDIEDNFKSGIDDIRRYEAFLRTANNTFFINNHRIAKKCVKAIVNQTKKQQNDCK